jgi:hypothetical protein
MQHLSPVVILVNPCDHPSMAPAPNLDNTLGICASWEKFGCFSGTCVD